MLSSRCNSVLIQPLSQLNEALRKYLRERSESWCVCSVSSQQPDCCPSAIQWATDLNSGLADHSEDFWCLIYLINHTSLFARADHDCLSYIHLPWPLSHDHNSLNRGLNYLELTLSFYSVLVDFSVIDCLCYTCLLIQEALRYLWIWWR